MDFAFGTYIPAQTPVHALNAQVKIVLTCVFSISVFLVDGWAGIGLLTLLVALLYALARIKVTKALHGLLPVAFILAFTIVVHAFRIDLGGAQAPGAAMAGSLGLTQQWVLFGTFGLTLDGLVCGLFFALRIALLVAACSLLTFTTSMVALTDGMLKLLGPLRKAGAPIDDIAMMVSIALRFIPTTAQEARTIQLAQKARCAEFDDGNVLKRVKAWVPVLIPLFVRLFRRADELAEAMDARCYAGGVRTSAVKNAVHARDIAVLVVLAVVFVAICIML